MPPHDFTQLRPSSELYFARGIQYPDAAFQQTEPLQPVFLEQQETPYVLASLYTVNDTEWLKSLTDFRPDNDDEREMIETIRNLIQ
jgi:hypothetical protein